MSLSNSIYMPGSAEKHLHYIFLTAFIIIQVFFLLFNLSTYGGADNIVHYQTARYSFKYPELLLDLWGRPVYTTLLAPFTLYGYNFAKAFNLVIACLTLYLSSRIANRLYPGSSIFTIILIAFSPVYFFLVISCLTEVLFSFVLIVSIYFFIKRRFSLSAVIISFIPFVRIEGVIILPLFALALLLKRRPIPILWLFAGIIFYSLTGYFVFGDILWLINKMPYSLGESIYGSGDLFHFVEKSPGIFGIPFIILLVTGSVFWIYELLKKLSLRDDNLILFILIAGSWLVYFAGHSYVWWRGTGGSLGLERVMGGIIPLAALTAIKSYDLLLKGVRRRYFVNGVLAVFSVIQIVLLFTQNELPLKADPTSELVKKGADYIRYNEAGAKIYYFNPLVVHLLEIDPYDTGFCNWGVAVRQQPSNSMEWGDILIWDAQFGPNEGGVAQAALENDPYLKKIKSFYPMGKITVLGGHDYSVQIFEKSKLKNERSVVVRHAEQVLTFGDYINEHVIEVDGEKVWEMDKSQEFSPTIISPMKNIMQKDIMELHISINFRALETIVNGEALLVLSVENGGEKLRYETSDLISNGGVWEFSEMNVKMPGNIPASSEIGVYIWNKERKNFLIKELRVNIESY